MKTTSNYGLKKPDLTDVVDIQNFNDNADIIDSELSKRALKTDIKVTSVAGKTGAVTLDKTNVGLGSVNNWGASTAVNNTSTTTYATASAVKQAYDKAVEVFNSSTDGKKKLAQAITDKGVSTSASDTFSTMANNINKIPNGVTINGQQTSGNINIGYQGIGWQENKQLPYFFSYGGVVVYNGEIHMLGGDLSAYMFHYKWTGTSWTNLPNNLPYKFAKGCAVVYNNEIHLLGGNGGTNTTYDHYKWNGSSWSKMNRLPFSFYNGSVVIYNNEIHILGGSGGTTEHYKWNGSTWTRVSTLPYGFCYGGAVVYNNEIHILGGGIRTNDQNRHYKLTGTIWQTISALPYHFDYGGVIIYNNEIHIVGGDDNRQLHYRWNGIWHQMSDLQTFFYTGAVVIYKNALHLLCHSSELPKSHTNSISLYYIE